ncbi:alpha/beta hydrolase [Membranicola marinus]|uniref:Alpha/beta hydrolase n=1 Tax=Membranihabitans marinus TaxID=1227546 RepID=A0A953I135_9BACT|nr:alpha/beta hydrolase [Membranihabitans marinus]MBY5959342.1 alpha/beta hydrolase [Membranihabitans marinus]
MNWIKKGNQLRKKILEFEDRRLLFNCFSMRDLWMKLLITLISIFYFTTLNYAQTVDTIYLWPDKVPGENKPKHEPKQTANTSGHVVRLTDVTNPAVMVFKPKASLNNGAGVIVCPGGGYRILAMDKEGYEIAEWLNTLGFTAFVLQYRVPNKPKEALYDIQRAIKVIRSMAPEWRLNTSKLGVLGFSAGGDLSALASTRYNIESYPKMDSIDSISCRPDFALLVYAAYLDKGINRSLRPELLVDRNTPPMFIFGTADDSHGNSSLVMATALRDNKIPVELHLLPEGGHGYGMRTGNIAAETWPALAEIWLQKVVNNE